MSYFAFEIILRTRPENSLHGKILGALAETWVKAASLESAAKRIEEFFAETEWEFERVLTEMQTSLNKHPFQLGAEPFFAVRESGIAESYDSLIKTGIGYEVFPFTFE